jgi:hypothetical protein
VQPRVDLNLIRVSLRQLNNSTFFEPRLQQYCQDLIEVISHVLEVADRYDIAIERNFAAYAMNVHSYLSGSTTNEIPYEVIYCLNDALHRWEKRETIIVTQLTEGHDFHFNNLDIWAFIKQWIVRFQVVPQKPLLVLIGVPKLYAHKPVFCIPLYHELGHFIDLSNSITTLSMLQFPNRISVQGADEARHRMEYFADLFCACFVGRSSTETLEAIAPDDPVTVTHPSTLSRVQLVDEFLTGKKNYIVDMFQEILRNRGQPELEVIFSEVSIYSEFNDLRTFAASNMEDVHGLVRSAWGYMFDTINSNRNPWHSAQASADEVERITNDLTEKSIRNFSIKAKWNETT